MSELSGTDLPISVYLARHGRTDLNAAGLLRGHLDPPLDEVGRQEAISLASALAAFRPSLIVSSPLQRAMETARRIAEECGLDVEIEDQLVDRDYGPWSGRALAEVHLEWGSVDRAPGVEPREAVRERALAALERVADRVNDGAVMVAHDAINRLLIDALAPGRFGVVEDIPQRTACFNLLQRTNDLWRVAGIDVCPASQTSAEKS
jgi:broad specificity phosphatase PhoE